MSRAIDRRAFIEAGMLASAGLVVAPGRILARAGTETLPNGIILPDPWPPRGTMSAEPVTPPYLLSPPAIIPIDVGRQLFVDDFLIETTTLVRALHRPIVHADPVLGPDRPWEQNPSGAPADARTNPTAAVFSDGVLWDARDRTFKMWYMGGYAGATCYATSSDGIRWAKPLLDVVPGTNIVNPMSRDSSTVWLDPQPTPAARFKMACSIPGGGRTTQKKFLSADGIHWTASGETPPVGDRTTFFYNPFRKRWVFSLRAGGEVGEPPRHRRYVEAASFESARWTERDAVYWTAAGPLDARRADLKAAPQLYNLDCVAYESLILGLFSIWRGESSQRHKHVDVCVGFSRDGFHWHRPDRQPFISPSEDAASWRHTNVQSAGGGCLIVGPRLHFYFSGRSGRARTSDPGTCSTGLATLRRDGFASMTTRGSADADAGQLTTRPLSFGGRHLFVNADCAEGELRAEILDAGGRVVPGFSRADSRACRVDSTCARMEWNGGGDLSRLSGSPLRLRWLLTRGHFYSFWVSRDPGGASDGYAAMGGPGLAERDGTGTRPR